MKDEQNKIAALKDWFIYKNFDEEDARAIRKEAYLFDILTETEKAYHFSIHVSDRAILAWVPKSVCLTQSDLDNKNTKLKQKDD